ncbi:MAG TPA: hypothetical protein VHO29_05305 [Marmoricola sp.]|nr:hypothetical protein [Marmoricola sp.]
MRTPLAGLAGLVALAAPAMVALPSQAAAPAESWVMTSPTVHSVEHPIRITAVGPISGSGVLTQTEEQTPTGEVVHFTWHFQTGTVTGDAVEEYGITFDPTACTAKATSTGTWTLTGGTGSYTGASGHGTFHGHATLVGSRDSRGQCLGPETNVEPKVAIAVLKGTGEADKS